MRHRHPTGQSGASVAIGSAVPHEGHRRKPVALLDESIDCDTRDDQAQAEELDGRESLIEQQRCRYRNEDETERHERVWPATRPTIRLP